jgi:hypothetical protein
MNADGPLRLLARDTDDIKVLAACLQDAVVLVREMRFLPGERRFVMVANRFRWEDAGRERTAEGTPVYERVHCGVCFENVTAVRQRGLDQTRPGQIAALLTIEAGEGAVELTFSGSATVRLEVDRLLCHVRDINEPWPTQWRPAHPLDDEA